MRPGHFEALRPVCPVCRSARQAESELVLASVAREEPGHIVEGLLQCPHPACLREYPIIDGIPLIIADIRGYVANNLSSIHARDDLGELSESILGDCAGPGSAFVTTREHLSMYAWDHYGDLDPAEDEATPGPGSVVEVLNKGLELTGRAPESPAIDIGCSVGRTSFELAARGEGLVLGVDLHFAMLRLAARVLRYGRVAYPRKRVGIVYDRREFPADLAGRERVDFWACDATALPLAAGTFATAVSLNVLDCVPSPREFLASLATVLKPGGTAVFTTPYDWSPAATPLEAWLGGHSQRSDNHGASEPVLRALLSPGLHPAAVAGLDIVAEEPALPWYVRLHERSVMHYRVHLLVARATGGRSDAGQAARA